MRERKILNERSLELKRVKEGRRSVNTGNSESEREIPQHSEIEKERKIKIMRAKKGGEKREKVIFPPLRWRQFPIRGM